MATQEKEPTPKNIFKVITSYSVLVAVIFAFIFGFGIGRITNPKEIAGTGSVKNTDARPEYLTDDVDFNEFWQVWKYVKDNYYKIIITTMIKQFIRKKLNDNITTIF